MVRSICACALVAAALSACSSDCPEQTCNCGQPAAGSGGASGGTGGATGGSAGTTGGSGGATGGTGGETGGTGGATGGSAGATGGSAGASGGSGGATGGSGGGTGGTAGATGGSGGGTGQCACTGAQVPFEDAGAGKFQATLALDPVGLTCSLHSGYESANEAMVITDSGIPTIQARIADQWKPSNGTNVIITWFQSAGGYYQLDFQRGDLVTVTLTHDNDTEVILKFTVNPPVQSTVTIDSACFQ